MAAARACVQLTPGPDTVTDTVRRAGTLLMAGVGGRSQISLLHVPLTTTSEGEGLNIRPHEILLIMYFDMIDSSIQSLVNEE